ncbi:MAG: response regulator, partial [Candidatus Latescibacteria bacterium]|nr:response regulator [Candidatus Latescibacterota bacterium]
MPKIVVMEDDDVVRGLLVKLVKSRGDEALAFEDAQLALDAVDFGAVDLVLTDLNMPTPGDKAVRQIRAEGIQTPVIMLTGQLLPDAYRESLVALGECRIMAKPFRLRELLAAMDDMMPNAWVMATCHNP